MARRSEPGRTPAVVRSASGVLPGAAFERGGSAARPAMHSHSHSPLRWAVKTALFWTAVALVVAPVVGRIIDEQGK